MKKCIVVQLKYPISASTSTSFNPWSCLNKTGTESAFTRHVVGINSVRVLYGSTDHESLTTGRRTLVAQANITLLIVNREWRHGHVVEIREPLT